MVAKVLIKDRQTGNQREGWPEQADQRNNGTRRTAKREPNTTAKFTILVPAETGHREHLVELLGAHPLLALDHDAPRPGQRAAEAG